MKLWACILLFGLTSYAGQFDFTEARLEHLGCVHIIVRGEFDLPEMFFLEANQERALIGVYIRKTDQRSFFGISDYIGAHDHVIDTIEQISMFQPEIFPSTNEEVIWAGEILIRNSLPFPAYGKIAKVNVTSGYVFEEIERQNRIKFARLHFRNEADPFLAQLQRTNPDLLSSKVEIYRSFAEMPHILTYNPGDLRHCYYSALKKVLTLLKARKPLPDTLYFGQSDARSMSTEEFIEKSRWLVAHLKEQLKRKGAFYPSPIPLLERWQKNEPFTEDDEWEPLDLQMAMFESDFITLADRVSVIDMGK